MVEYYHTLDERIGRCALNVVDVANKTSNHPFIIHGGCATQIYIILHCQKDEWGKYLRTTSDLDLAPFFRVTKSTFRKLLESLRSRGTYSPYKLKGFITHNFYSIQLYDEKDNIFQIHIPKLSEKEYKKRMDDILRIYNGSEDVEVFNSKVKVENPETNIYNKLQRCHKILENKLENRLYRMLDQVSKNPYSVKEELYRLRSRAIAEIESLGYSSLLPKIKVLKDLYDISILYITGIVDKSTLQHVISKAISYC